MSEAYKNKIGTQGSCEHKVEFVPYWVENPYLRFRGLVGGMDDRTAELRRQQQAIEEELAELKLEEEKREADFVVSDCVGCIHDQIAYQVCTCECYACEFLEDCGECRYHVPFVARSRFDQNGLTHARLLPRGDGHAERMQAAHNRLMHSQNGNTFDKPMENQFLENVVEELAARYPKMLRQVLRRIVHNDNYCVDCLGINGNCMCMTAFEVNAVRERREERQTAVNSGRQVEARRKKKKRRKTKKPQADLARVVVEETSVGDGQLVEIEVGPPLIEEKSLEPDCPEELGFDSPIVIEERGERGLVEVVDMSLVFDELLHRTRDRRVEAPGVEQKDDCVICFEALVGLLTTTACGHRFHSMCLSTWLRQRNNCPSCRADVDVGPFAGVVNQQVEEFEQLPDVVAWDTANVFRNGIGVYGDDVPPPVDRFNQVEPHAEYTGLAFDLWSWQACRNTRNYDVIINTENNTAKVDGIFKFQHGDDVRQIKIFQTMPLLRCDAPMRRSTLCGTICEVERMVVGGPMENLIHHQVGNGVTDIEGVIKRIALSLCRLIIKAEGVIDHQQAIMRVKSVYNRHYKEFATIDSIIEKVITDTDFLCEVERLKKSFKPSRVQRMKIAVHDHLSESSDTYCSLKTWTIVKIVINPLKWIPAAFGGEEYVLEQMVSTIKPKNLLVSAPCSGTYFMKTDPVRDFGWNPDDEVTLDFSRCSEEFIEKWQLRPPKVSFRQCDFKVKQGIVETFGIVIDQEMTCPESNNNAVAQAVYKRMLFDRDFDEQMVDDCDRHVCEVQIPAMPELHLDLKSLEQWLKEGHYNQAQQKMIVDAFNEGPLTESDWTQVLFSKTEAYIGKSPEDAKFRMISKASAKFIAHFGPWCSAIGKALGKTYNAFTSRFIAKKTTPREVGMAIERMRGKFMCKSDISNNDGSMMPWHKKWFLLFLETKVFPKCDSYAWLVEHFGISKVTTEDKTFMLELCWALLSGMPWTTDFNCLMNFFMLQWALDKTWDDPSLDMTVLGDDNVWACDEDFDVDEITNKYRGIGMKVELIRCVDPEDMGFCSGVFIPVDGHLSYANLPFRQLVKWGMNLSHIPKHLKKRALYGFARCLMTTLGHMPIFGELLRRVCQCCEDAGLSPYYTAWGLNPHRIQGGPVSYPDFDSYEWFSRRYGISVGDQLEIEREIAKVCLDDFPLFFDAEWIRYGLEVDLGEYKPNSSFQQLNEYYLITVVDPIVEEIEKQSIARKTGRNILSVAYDFGYAEYLKGAPYSNIFKHMFYAAAETLVPGLGIKLHQENNIRIMDTIGDGMMACSGRKNKKKKVVVKEIVITKKKKKRNRRKKRRGISGRVTPQLAALIDPFSKSGIGAKYPDDFSYPTDTWMMRSAIKLVGTSASGNLIGASVFTPFPPIYSGLPSSILANGGVSWSGGITYNCANLAGLHNVASEYRVCAWGLKIKCLTSEFATDGQLYVVHVPNNLADSVMSWEQLPIDEAGFEAVEGCYRVNLSELVKETMLVRGKPVDEGVYRFRDINYPQNASPYAETSSGWSYIALYYIGSSQIPNINVEWVAHVEYIVNPSLSNVMLGNSKPEPLNRQLLDAGMNLAQILPDAEMDPMDRKEVEEPTFDKVLRMIKGANAAASEYAPAIKQGLRVFSELRAAFG